jgi:hypothetical protein
MDCCVGAGLLYVLSVLGGLILVSVKQLWSPILNLDVTSRNAKQGNTMNKLDTRDNGKVRLGDAAPAFAVQIRTRTVRAGDKVVSDATEDKGNVRLGDAAPIWR